MTKRLRVLFAVGALMAGVTRTYAGESPLLCCQTFNGTDATNCTLAQASGCKGDLVLFDCDNNGNPSALVCAPAQTKLAAGYGAPATTGNDCRCVTVAFGSTPN